MADYLNSGNVVYGVVSKNEWYETGSIDGYVGAFKALAEERESDKMKLI